MQLPNSSTYMLKKASHTFLTSGMRLFIAGLFVIVKWKKIRGCTNIYWHIHAMEHRVIVQVNELEVIY